jgi:hypothetical protein
MSPQLKTTLSFALLLPACIVQAPDDKEEPNNQNPGVDAGGGGTGTLSSGVYAVRSPQFTDNLCGASASLFFPEAMTLEISGGSIAIEEMNLSGSFDGESFRLENRYQINYQDQLLECVLDFDARMDGEVAGKDRVAIEFRIEVDEAPLEPDADCEFVAQTDLGLTSWNSLTGCLIEGSMQLER